MFPPSLLMMSAVVVLLAIIVAMYMRANEKAAKIWGVVAEGEYDYVVYGYYDYPKRSGAMVHTTTHYKMDVTAVYFTDGRAYVTRGRKDMPFARGTRIRILENPLGSRKIEQATGAA